MDPAVAEQSDNEEHAQKIDPSSRQTVVPPLPSTSTGSPSSHEPTPIPKRRGSEREPLAAIPQPIVDEDDPDGEEIVRTVRAISNRLDPDIRIGRRNRHQLVALAAPIAAAALLIAGTYGAYSRADLGRLAPETPSQQGAEPGTLAFGEERSSAAQRKAEAVATQVNEIVSINCSLPMTANAIMLSPTRLVTNAAAITNDARPVIRFADNTSRVGTVVGLDRKTNVAVIEIEPVAGGGALQWGVTDQIFQNPNVVIVERFGAAINGRPALVDKIDGVVGLVKSYSFDGASFRPGSAVLNSEGFIIGMVDETGQTAVGGTELSAAYGRVIARPSSPAVSCPADPTE